MIEDTRSQSQDSGSVLSVWSSADLDVHLLTERFQPHQGSYERLDELWIYLCTEGGGRLVRRSSGQQIDGLFLPGTVGVGSPADGGEGFWPALTLIGLGIEPPRLATLIEELPGRKFDLEAIASTFHHDAVLVEVLREMWACASLHGYSTAFLDHGLAVVFHQLVRRCDSARITRTHFSLSSVQLGRIVEFMDAQLADNISVERLADIVGLSPNHFSNCFRASTGLAPYQFLTRRRLDRAAETLIATRLPVAQIGAMIGYANPSHFSAAFRRYKGTTPAAWRHERSVAFVQT